MGEVYSHLSEEERRVIRIEIGNGTICVLASWRPLCERCFSAV